MVGHGRPAGDDVALARIRHRVETVGEIQVDGERSGARSARGRAGRCALEEGLEVGIAAGLRSQVESEGVGAGSDPDDDQSPRHGGERIGEGSPDGGVGPHRGRRGAGDGPERVERASDEPVHLSGHLSGEDVEAGGLTDELTGTLGERRRCLPGRCSDLERLPGGKRGQERLARPGGDSSTAATHGTDQQREPRTSPHGKPPGRTWASCPGAWSSEDAAHMTRDARAAGGLNRTRRWVPMNPGSPQRSPGPAAG